MGPMNLVTAQVSHMCKGKRYEGMSDSFSFTALFTPSLPQNSSKVASSSVCSLTRQCHGAPSAGPFGRDKVRTLPLAKVFPFFHATVESRRSFPRAMIVSSEGISDVLSHSPLTKGVEQLLHTLGLYSRGTKLVKHAS